MPKIDLNKEQIEEILDILRPVRESLDDDEVHWNIGDEAEEIALNHRKSVLDDIIHLLENA